MNPRMGGNSIGNYNVKINESCRTKFMPNNNDTLIVLILSGVAMLFLSCYIGV